MSIHRAILIAVAALLAALLLFASRVAGAAPSDDAVRKRIGDAGCTICHRDAPAPREAGDAPPLAPSFADIAHRYRGQRNAESRLARIVVGGAKPGERHWNDRLEFTSMGANAPRVTNKEARAFVRWILSQS